MNTRKVAYISMLVALYLVLAILTPIKIIQFKFTFEAFPILVGGFMFGSKEGFLIGTLGSFLYQILFSSYGLTPTTLLWVLPHSLSGLLVGYLSEKLNFNLNIKSIFLISVASAILVTCLNTLALFIDSKLYGYYSFALVFSTIGFKFLAGIILALLFTSIIPSLLKRLKKA
ncbi:MAG: ECF transporter S component [Erysipelotrichaceae bacterium]